jgi:magnesium transporter
MWWSAGGSANGQALILGLVILFSMIGACMASGLFGVLVPLTLRRFGADPCTASSIFLTTGTDIAGMGLMLGLATVFVL